MPARPGVVQVVPAEIADPHLHQCRTPSLGVGLGDQFALAAAVGINPGEGLLTIYTLHLYVLHKLQNEAVLQVRCSAGSPYSAEPL